MEALHTQKHAPVRWIIEHKHCTDWSLDRPPSQGVLPPGTLIITGRLSKRNCMGKCSRQLLRSDNVLQSIHACDFMSLISAEHEHWTVPVWPDDGLERGVGQYDVVLSDWLALEAKPLVELGGFSGFRDAAPVGEEDERVGLGWGGAGVLLDKEAGKGSGGSIKDVLAADENAVNVKGKCHRGLVIGGGSQLMVDRGTPYALDGPQEQHAVMAVVPGWGRSRLPSDAGAKNGSAEELEQYKKHMNKRQQQKAGADQQMI